MLEDNGSRILSLMKLCRLMAPPVFTLPSVVAEPTCRLSAVA